MQIYLEKRGFGAVEDLVVIAVHNEKYIYCYSNWQPARQFSGDVIYYNEDLFQDRQRKKNIQQF